MRDTPTRTPTLWLATLIVAVLFVRAPAEQAPSTSDNAPAPARAAERDDKREARPAITAQLSPVHRLLARHWGLANVEGSLRATHLESGLSPITPIILVGIGLLTMFRVEARRSQLLGRFTTLYPLKSYAKGQRRFDALVFDPERLRQQLLWAAPLEQVARPKFFRPVVAAAFVLLVIAPAAALFWEISFALDSVGWRRAFWCGAVGLEATLVLAMFRFLSVWQEMRKLMRTLTTSPLRNAFGRLPAHLGKALGFEPDATTAPWLEAQHALDQLDILRSHFPKRGLSRQEHEARVALALTSHHVEEAFRKEHSAATHTHRNVPLIVTETQLLLADAVPQLLPPLAAFWDAPPLCSKDSQPNTSGASDKRPADAVTRTRAGLVAADNLRIWYEAAEEFVAVQVTTFLSYLFVYLRSALVGMTTAFVLLLLAITSYPFAPQTVVLNFLMLLMALAVVLGVITFRQASRNMLLSLLKGTTPDVVTWNSALAKTFAIYIGIPVLAALAAQMPALGRVVNLVLSAFPR